MDQQVDARVDGGLDLPPHPISIRADANEAFEPIDAIGPGSNLCQCLMEAFRGNNAFDGINRGWFTDVAASNQNPIARAIVIGLVLQATGCGGSPDSFLILILNDCRN